MGEDGDGEDSGDDGIDGDSSDLDNGTVDVRRASGEGTFFFTGLEMTTGDGFPVPALTPR